MPIEDLTNQEFVDIFQSGQQSQPGKVSFGASETVADMFSVTDTTTQASTTETTTASTTDTTTQAPDDGQTTKQDADILGVKDKPKETALTDLSSYFEDRLKSKKFVAIEDVQEDGTKKIFIPKTAEEFDEVIDIQVNYKLEQREKEVEEKWYQSKSPAWQAVAKFAEMTDNPGDVLPFISTIQTIQTVKDINENEIEGAEQIVRTRLAQRGDPQKVIDSQIDSLKTTDRLIETAKEYKPLILQQESRTASQMLQQKQAEEKEWEETVSRVRDGAIKAIEAPIFGTQLKQEEKAAVYDLIALPTKETQGYAIYSKIDELFDKGDFNTLKEVALLLAKRESYLGYISTGVANKTAEGLQRKLRVAAETNAAGGKDQYDDERRVVQRNQYNSSTPRFGR